MENKVKISKRTLLVVALLLVIAAAVTAYLNQRNISDTTHLTIYEGEQQIARYSMKDLTEMKPVSADADLSSSGGRDVQGRFTGVWLFDLLQKEGIADGQYETILLIAGDGYTAAAKKEEAKDILVAYQQDGELLGDYEKGGTGPLRCIFPKDTYGNRSVMYLTKIKLL